MPKFMLIYHGKPYSPELVSPEAMQQSMQAWNAWIGQGFAEGWMVDPGDALLPSGKVVTDKKKVTDGPFTEGKEIVGGYSVVMADTYDAALEKAKSCPHLMETSSSVEVRQMAELSPPK